MGYLDDSAHNSAAHIEGAAMRSGKLSFTTRYVLLFGVLLFLANTVLGIVVFNQSKNAMRTLISKDMLDVVNSAAASLDGDVMGALTEDDVDGEVFHDIEERLLVFQRSTDIEFIYAVKQAEDGTYVFTVDPDPVDPGAFGEPIVTTPGLIQAGQGVPSVDSAAVADRWGNFYSAFSPIRDSSGAVVGVVGVDFDSSWYQSQLHGYLLSIALVTALSVILGGVVVAIISDRVRKRFRELDHSLSALSGDMDRLMDEMVSYTGREALEAHAPHDSPEVSDELGILGGKIHTMQDEMGLYLDYLHMQAYTDSLTKVGNTTAYHEAVRSIDKRIADGTESFLVAVFDLNSLKELNDDHGHECGDIYIQGAARALQRSFADAQIYRIGGDEFAVLAEGLDERQLGEVMQRFDEEIGGFNETSPYPATLSVSRGASWYLPDQDSSYADVFARADQAMYDNKSAYYRDQPEHDRRGSGPRCRPA